MRGRVALGTVLAIVLAGSLGAETPSSGRSKISDLLKGAKPGSSVLVPAGVYLEDVKVPDGVSLRGEDPRTTVLVGSIWLAGAEKTPVTLSSFTLIHDGDRSGSLVEAKGKAVIEHCLIISRGGFSTVYLRNGGDVVVRNCIVHGPAGDYALFARGEGNRLAVVNCHIEVHGFGVGLMDGAFAEIRNCLIYGDRRPAVIRTASDYVIAYSNICLSGGGASYPHDLFNADSQPSRGPGEGVPSDPIGCDKPKYDSTGLTFKGHEFSESRDIESYKAWVPAWARNAGDPSAACNNPDGSRNTMGAFGGPSGRWP